METALIDTEKERREIIRQYRALLREAHFSKSREDRAQIRKEFDIAIEAHKDMSRKSG